MEKNIILNRPGEVTNVNLVENIENTIPLSLVNTSISDCLNHNIIDNALIIYFPGPNTVTGEDVIELHIHGSTIIEKKIYQVQKKLCLNKFVLTILKIKY